MPEHTTKKAHKQQKAHTVQPAKEDPPPSPGQVAGGIFGVLLLVVWCIAVPIAFGMAIWAFWMFVFKSIGKAFRRGQNEADRALPHPRG